jgi:hypothetical protein
MAQLTTDKITEIYCITDDFCKEFSKEIKKHQILSDDGKLNSRVHNKRTERKLG